MDRSLTYSYYYNDVPGHGLCRNNLIYTSLISNDQQVFCQWYYNDGEYHKGQNEVVDPSKMQEKWEREVKYLTLMSANFPDLVPEILEVDHENRKLYIKVDGLDFWNRAGCLTENYDAVLPDWKDQMLEILKAHKSLGIYKYSMHPSSYFVVNGRLKSMNYFFAYHKSEPLISINDVSSHIHSNRQAEMRKYTDSVGIQWDAPQSFDLLQTLCWESFRTNYPADFIEAAKNV